jgi:hypothetical protein
MDPEKRKEWSLLRYNYYSSGRSELLLGNYGAAGILLGYANETILKKHQPQILMRECRSHGILNEVEVSDDFLDYINDHFKPRYPSLKTSVQEEISSQNKVDIFGPLLLSWYDDLLFQIDNWISYYTKDRISSCFFRATGDTSLLRGRLFFHANFHACTDLNRLIDMRGAHDGGDSPLVSELERGVSHLWSNVSGVWPAQKFENVNYIKNFSKRFYYAKWSTGERPSIQIKDWNCIMINLLPWE